MADITQDGDFSSFPDVQRWFAVLDGGGIELQVSAYVQRLFPGDAPACFDGGQQAQVRLLAGVTHDLNLMTRGCVGLMQAANPEQSWHSPYTAGGLFVTSAVHCSDGMNAYEIPPFTLLWFDHCASLLVFYPVSDPVAVGAAYWLSVETRNPC